MTAAGATVAMIAPEPVRPSLPDVQFSQWRRAAAGLIVLFALAATLFAGFVLYSFTTASATIKIALAATLASAALILFVFFRRRALNPFLAPHWVMSALRNRAQIESLAVAAAAFKPTAILVVDPDSLPAGVAAKTRTGARLVYDAHELHEEEDPSDPSRKPYIARIESAAAKHLDAFVTVNEGIAGLYSERRPEFPKAVVVRNAIATCPPPLDDGRLRKTAGLPEGTRILLYQGGLAPMRGLETLVLAASHLPARWAVVLMGSGRLEPELRRLADPERVRFISPAPYNELLNWTCGAHFGVILYEDTGLNQRYCSPNKIWEYAAARTPFIATDLPQIRAIAGECAFLIPPGTDARELGRLVGRISDLDYERARSACERLNANDAWPIYAERLVATLSRPT